MLNPNTLLVIRYKMNKGTMTRLEALKKICDFIRSIGISIEEGTVPVNSFLPGIEIVNGALVYDNTVMEHPGDLLHEAGHIALIPTALRSQVAGNVAEQQLTDGGEEMAVMLWTYAACLHLQMPPEIVFHPNGYKGQSQWLLDTYAAGTFIGLPLLQWMGLCTSGEEGFPKMLRWLRD